MKSYQHCASWFTTVITAIITNTNFKIIILCNVKVSWRHILCYITPNQAEFTRVLWICELNFSLNPDKHWLSTNFEVLSYFRVVRRYLRSEAGARNSWKLNSEINIRARHTSHQPPSLRNTSTSAEFEGRPIFRSKCLSTMSSEELRFVERFDWHWDSVSMNPALLLAENINFDVIAREGMWKVFLKERKEKGDFASSKGDQWKLLLSLGKKLGSEYETETSIRFDRGK